MMKSWMLAVIMACNIQLVHKSKSSQLNYHNNMLAVLSASNVLHYGKNGLGISCMVSPYSEITKRLIVDSLIECQARHVSYKTGTTDESWHKVKISPLVRYIRALRWTPIPLGLGFALIAYQQLRHVKKRETAKIATASNPGDLVASNLSVSLYTMLPLRATSRFWGWVHNINLPSSIRKPVLNLFVSTYGCNVTEAIVEDLSKYRNLGEFFSRHLKKEVRPIHCGHSVVSPADGLVLHFGAIENDLVEQVKGITYSLKSFLGIKEDQDQSVGDVQCHKQLLCNKDNALYHCVIYLAPGDYHKFHSPTQWNVTHRQHFHGSLLSVCPGVVSWISGLFNINERVVYRGNWQHGFFSLTAVGATNVGSIKVFCDEALQTNQKKWSKGCCEEKHFNPPIAIKEKGELFGEFNLGSTIVLVFEAPKDIKFTIQSGQKIKYGEPISLCEST